MKGKILLVGLASVLAVGAWSPLRAQWEDCTANLPGCVDTAFGGGWVLWNPDTTWSCLYAVTPQVVNGEERILVAGHRTYYSWTMMRYLPDGTLDSTFGNGGIVDTMGGKGAVTFEQINALAVQTDYKIVAVGPLCASGRTWNFGIARYAANGQLDKTFAKTGKVVLAFGSKECWPRGVAIQTDGKIVVAGYVGDYPFVVRLNPNGSLDSTFGSSGKFTYNGAMGQFHAMILQTVGTEQRVLAAGELVVNNVRVNGLMRLTSRGVIDSSFGSGGIVTTDILGWGGSYNGLAADPEGRLVAVGEATTGPLTGHYDSNKAMAVVRYLRDGRLDTSFNAVGTRWELPRPGENLWGASGKAVAVRSDGSILVVGRTDRGAIWRFNPDGTPDVNFSADGLVETAMMIDYEEDAQPILNGLTMLGSGQFMVVGGASFFHAAHSGDTRNYPYTGFAVARFFN